MTEISHLLVSKKPNKVYLTQLLIISQQKVIAIDKRHD